MPEPMTEAQRDRYLALPLELRATFLEYKDSKWTLPDVWYERFAVVDVVAQALIEQRLGTWLETQLRCGHFYMMVWHNQAIEPCRWAVARLIGERPEYKDASPTRLDALLSCVEKAIEMDDK